MNRCEDFRERLEAYLEGSADPAVVAAVEAHLETCASCRGEVADVRQLMSAARELGPIEPPEHLWLEIAGQLRPATPEPTRVVRQAPRAVWQWVGLAAALLVITTTLYFVNGNSTAPPAPVSTQAVRQAPAGTVEAVNEELDRAVEHYERAIGELQALAAKGSTEIDPTVAAALDAEGQAIDRAIAESRSAVTTNPESESARVSLFDALRRKVNVLQATVALVTEMNQGDAAGASRAAENLGREL